MNRRGFFGNATVSVLGLIGLSSLSMIEPQEKHTVFEKCLSRKWHRQRFMDTDGFMVIKTEGVVCFASFQELQVCNMPEWKIEERFMRIESKYDISADGKTISYKLIDKEIFRKPSC